MLHLLGGGDEGDILDRRLGLFLDGFLSFLGGKLRRPAFGTCPAMV